MSTVTGSCAECGGKVISLDPEQDRVLYATFGSYLAEHNPGCSQYPAVTEVSPENL